MLMLMKVNNILHPHNVYTCKMQISKQKNTEQKLILYYNFFLTFSWLSDPYTIRNLFKNIVEYTINILLEAYMSK